MKFINWLQQYNKAFVAIVMVMIYLVNKHYGWELPIDESSTIAILGMLISGVTYLVPNKQVE